MTEMEIKSYRAETHTGISPRISSKFSSNCVLQSPGGLIIIMMLIHPIHVVHPGGAIASQGGA